MLNSKITVPLPETGIIVRRTGKYQYVYSVLETYRNEKGQPTNTRKLIGRLSSDGERLLPNDNYYELYGNTTELVFIPAFKSIVTIGSTFIIRHILKRLQACSILTAVFGVSRAEEILAAASYMICKGNVFEYVAEWHEEHAYATCALTPQKASALFATVSYDERMEFFRQWVKMKSDTDYISYDVTSFSSYAQGIKELEWGYNRDGDRLPQINLGCYIGQGSRLPLFYVTYPGSIVDKSHMQYMMAYNDDLGISSKVVFVMDRGFCSTSNVGYMHSNGLKYILGVEMRYKATRAAIDNVRDTILSMRNLVSEGVYGVADSSRYYGQSTTLHVFCNPEQGEQQRKDLLRLVESMEEELLQLSDATERELKRFHRFFDIVPEDGHFSFSRNYDRIDEAARNCGFFCILSNTMLSSQEVLATYRHKDTLEKSFDDIKNHLDMKRLRVHSDAAVAGKLFVAFIALLAISEISKSLIQYNKTSNRRSMTKDAFVSEMEKIKLVITDDGNRLLSPLSKTQRDLFALFSASEENLTSFLTAT